MRGTWKTRRKALGWWGKERRKVNPVLSPFLLHSAVRYMDRDSQQTPAEESALPWCLPYEMICISPKSVSLSVWKCHVKQSYSGILKLSFPRSCFFHVNKFRDLETVALRKLFDSFTFWKHFHSGSWHSLPLLLRLSSATITGCFGML